MAGVEENDIDRLLVNPPEKVEIEVKYKIDVTVMEGVSQTILKKVILVLLKISRMIKSKCTFRFSGCSWHTGLFLLLNKQRLNNRKLLLSRINYHRRSEFTEKISHRPFNSKVTVYVKDKVARGSAEHPLHTRKTADIIRAAMHCIFSHKCYKKAWPQYSVTYPP